MKNFTLFLLLTFAAMFIQAQTPTCQAGFSFPPTMCPTVQFSNNSTSSPGSIISHYWTFGDGGVSTNAQPYHVYNANGIYQICLTITTSDSCVSTHCDTININCLPGGQCQAGFQFTMPQCSTAVFSSTSTASPGTVTSYYWNFGDGGTSTSANPQHNYTSNGIYGVCLTIGTSNGCQSTFCDTITVNCGQTPTCQAAFQAYGTTNCSTYVFSNSSTSSPGNITLFSWNFGDGGTSTNPQPTHTYTANGVYQVCLFISTSDGCQSTYCQYITVNCVPTPTCQASFGWIFGANGCPNVVFIDSSTASPGNIVSWHFDFGDGSSLNVPTATHTYTANGDYGVCLTITTSDSCTSTWCDTISITCIQQPTCQAYFQYTLGACPTVSFFDASSTNLGQVTSWSWNFGDGSTSTAPNPQHTYTANGVYTVCLAIATSNGCTNTFCKVITVNCVQQPTCQAAFSWPPTMCPTVQFSNNSTSSPGSIISHYWTFGDGGVSTNAQPYHVYNANGIYQICLTITTSDSCVSTHCDTININCLPGGQCQAGFQFTMPQCSTALFSSTSTASPGIVTSYYWNFGDGGTSTSANPQHNYTSNGIYGVCLTIGTSNGCQSTFCDTITVNCGQTPTCQAAFQAYGTTICSTYVFSNSSTSSPGNITLFSWNFGDGGTSTNPQPTHTYTANGVYQVCLFISTSDGCQSTYCQYITVNCVPPPTCQAGFGWIFGANGCPNVVFIDSSTASPGNIVSWHFDFGDGSSLNVPTATHTYTANGDYGVCLTITTSDSCTSTWCDTICITCIQQPTCQAYFQYTLGACPTVSFFDASSTNLGQVTSWSWNFGDGSTSTAPNPQHTYTANGVYTVCLAIATSNGCTNTFCKVITVNCVQQPTCQAAFSWPPTMCPTVQFSNNSTSSPGSIISHYWTFGDGGVSTNAQPYHVYNANGIYQICLTITTSDSCVSTHCDTININCLPGGQCQAGFQFTMPQCSTALFSSTSTASPGIVTSYYWNFGDGGTSTSANPQHNYTSNGIYGVCLTIGTSNGCQSTFCDTITVNCGQTPTCQAAFQAYGTTICSTYVFSNSSTSSPGNITLFSWNFGDGGTSTNPQPTHTYTANGVYQVCLFISTSDGCQSTYCQYITVNCPPPPSCHAAFTWQFGPNGCPTVKFTGTSTSTAGNIISRVWNFGDGSTSTFQNPNHTYVADGIYPVCLTITTANNCTSTFCDTISITCINPVVCHAAFQWNFTPNGCPSTKFTDYSTASPGTVTSWHWTFGDGGTSSQKNPSHVYQANGIYTVCLLITSSDGCTSTFCDVVHITCYQPPVCQALFQIVPTNNPTFAFYDASTANPGTISDWEWDFGDGNLSNLQNPVHTYSQNGRYEVCLTIKTTAQCNQTHCDSVQVIITSLDELATGINQLNLFPNPANDHFSLSFNLKERGEIRLEMMNALGQMILQKSLGTGIQGENQFDLETNRLAEGSYLVRIWVNDAFVTRKLIIRR
ncbi:MAG: PKD domain-containing protein [Bacteroidia bacterium]|nr:PKD domain-containing protein [Bacteroidia bacterium]